MSTIQDMINRVKALDVSKVSTDTMEEAAPLLTVKQRQQLLQGKNSEGEKVGRYRNPAYSRMKQSMNPVPGFGVPDLRLTGEFFHGIYTDIRGEQVIIDSTDEKTQSLVDKYGEQIFGLNKSSKEELVENDLQPVFMKHVRNALKL